MRQAVEWVRMSDGRAAAAHGAHTPDEVRASPHLGLSTSAEAEERANLKFSCETMFKSRAKMHAFIHSSFTLQVLGQASL